jgi:hypothetical protein
MDVCNASSHEPGAAGSPPPAPVRTGRDIGLVSSGAATLAALACSMALLTACGGGGDDGRESTVPVNCKSLPEQCS